MRSYPCKYCNYPRTRFLLSMTNVVKYVCPNCHKANFYSKEQPAAPKRTPGKDCYFFFNHQGKADAYVEALSKKYEVKELSRDVDGVKFVLTDTDVLHRVKKLEKIRKYGVKRFFVYSHAARPNLFNDIYPPYSHTTAQFVSAEGHIEIKKRFGYPKPLHAVGWHLCPIFPFTPRPEARRILFAPIHPRCADIDKEANRKTFEKLSNLAIRDKISLTVRYIRDLGEGGMEQVPHPNIEYIQGQLENGNFYNIVKDYDAVVSHQTFAWKAVASGIPTLMMAEEELVTHVMTNPIRFVNSWGKYKDLLCYPLDILKEEDALSLIQRACTCDDEIRDWRRRMIGEPFNPSLFVETLESYL